MEIRGELTAIGMCISLNLMKYALTTLFENAQQKSV